MVSWMLSRIPFTSSRLVLLDSQTVLSVSNCKDAITWLSVDLTSFARGSSVSGELLLHSFTLNLTSTELTHSGISHKYSKYV